MRRSCLVISKSKSYLLNSSIHVRSNWALYWLPNGWGNYSIITIEKVYFHVNVLSLNNVSSDLRFHLKVEIYRTIFISLVMPRTILWRKCIFQDFSIFVKLHFAKNFEMQFFIKQSTDKGPTFIQAFLLQNVVQVKITVSKIKDEIYHKLI